MRTGSGRGLAWPTNRRKKVAVVTGGASGIGRGTAERFVAAGARHVQQGEGRDDAGRARGHRFSPADASAEYGRGLANAALFLVSDHSSYITRTLLPVDGGTQAGSPASSSGFEQMRSRLKVGGPPWQDTVRRAVLWWHQGQLTSGG